MKLLASALAMISLFTAAPALASDVSSDRYFAESKAAQSRALESLKATTEAMRPSRHDRNERCACSCARSADPQAIRGEPGRH